MEGRERGARAAGFEAGNRRLARRHASGKVALSQPRGYSRVANLFSHLQRQTSRAEGLVELDALVKEGFSRRPRVPLPERRRAHTVLELTDCPDKIDDHPRKVGEVLFDPLEPLLHTVPSR